MLNGKLTLFRMHTGAFVRETVCVWIEDAVIYCIQILFSSSDSCVHRQAGNLHVHVLATYFRVCPEWLFV